MQGVGIARRDEPLLEPLESFPEGALRAGPGPLAQYFNAHPFLAGAAVGALARAELDQEPGERILRLRTALSGPLGALGDQLFWAGIVPATMGLALIAMTFGGGLRALALSVAVYNLPVPKPPGDHIGLVHGEGGTGSQSWLPRPSPGRDGRALIPGLPRCRLVAAWLLRRGSPPPRHGACRGRRRGLGRATIRRPLWRRRSPGRGGSPRLWLWSHGVIERRRR